MIQAKIVADSICNGHRITTMEVTIPRMILAEFNTHRMFSRNSASSRAIPLWKTIKTLRNNSFTPMAWQKEHAGMQGTEYFDNNEKFKIYELEDIMIPRLMKALATDSEDKSDFQAEFDRQLVAEAYHRIIYSFPQGEYTLAEFWHMIRDKVIDCALLLLGLGVTKQIANRLLEPFMWQTVLCTATEWENFFALRCPQYEIPSSKHFEGQLFRSRKDVLKALKDHGEYQRTVDFLEKEANDIDWLETNKGKAEIHMMAVAEAMWNAFNESKPRELKPGEWHIPYGDSITDEQIKEVLSQRAEMRFDAPGKELAAALSTFIEENQIDRKVYAEGLLVPIATARCAQVSYTVIDQEGKPMDLNKLLSLCERLAKSGHWSCFEHCARAMNEEEYDTHYNGVVPFLQSYKEGEEPEQKYLGWSGNFRGWIQYRKMFKNENLV